MDGKLYRNIFTDHVTYKTPYNAKSSGTISNEIIGYVKNYDGAKYLVLFILKNMK